MAPSVNSTSENVYVYVTYAPVIVPQAKLLVAVATSVIWSDANILNNTLSTGAPIFLNLTDIVLSILFFVAIYHCCNLIFVPLPMF